MSNPTLVVGAAGAVNVAGGFKRNRRWTQSSTKAVVATLALMVIASAANGTQLAPIVRALAWLMFIAAVFSALRK